MRLVGSRRKNDKTCIPIRHHPSVPYLSDPKAVVLISPDLGRFPAPAAAGPSPGPVVQRFQAFIPCCHLLCFLQRSAHCHWLSVSQRNRRRSSKDFPTSRRRNAPRYSRACLVLRLSDRCSHFPHLFPSFKEQQHLTLFLDACAFLPCPLPCASCSCVAVHLRFAYPCCDYCGERRKGKGIWKGRDGSDVSSCLAAGRFQFHPDFGTGHTDWWGPGSQTIDAAHVRPLVLGKGSEDVS
jgi:hypothetical protein